MSFFMLSENMNCSGPWVVLMFQWPRKRVHELGRLHANVSFAYPLITLALHLVSSKDFCGS